MIYLEKVRITVRTLKNNIALELIVTLAVILKHRANEWRVLVNYLWNHEKKYNIRKKFKQFS